LKEEQKTKEEVDAKAAAARNLQEDEEELERLIREMEDAEAKRLAKQAAEKAAANKFAADKRTSLDQLSAMEGKYESTCTTTRPISRRSSKTSTHNSQA
jgi:hypothetical protein